MQSLIRTALPLTLAVSAAASLPYGVIISSCTQPGQFALTFDDGPFEYTNQVLDQLAAAKMKATFFVTGDNFANINNYAAVVQRMVSDGHQVGSHTWSHPDMSQLSADGVASEMKQLDDALANLIGHRPTYMRPPFLSYTRATLDTLGNLGYHVITADIDTLDFQNAEPLGNEASLTIFSDGVAAGGTISLAHDVWQNTAVTLVPAFINLIRQKGLEAVTVGKCLGDAEANWYR